MANILIVTSEFSPFQSSGINRLSFFKSYLEKNGHEVFVLTTQTKSQGMERDKLFDQQNNIFRAWSLDLFIRRVLSSRKLPIYPKIAKSGKYTEWVPFAVSKGLKLVKDKKIDLVMTSFPDFSSIDAAEKIAAKANKKLITDFRDPPYWIYQQNTRSKNIKSVKAIAERVIRTSQEIITCTNESSEGLEEYYKASKNFTLIANGYDLDIINQIKVTPSTNHKDYYEIVHIGSFYDEGRDMKRIVDALRAQSQYIDKPINLRLIGDEPNKETKQYILQTHNKVNVSIEPPLPMLEALAIAKASDALLLLQGSRFDRQIPTKAYEYLALNCVVWAVVGAKGATKKLLDENAENVVYADYDEQITINNSLNTLFNKQAIILNTYNLSRQAQASKLLDILVV